MKTKSLLTIVICLLLIKANAQPVFQKTYGGSNDESGLAVKPLSNGDYILFGWTKSFGAGNADLYLIKTNSGGDTLWTKTYGGIDSDSGLDLVETSDGGFILGGTTRTYGNGAGDCWIIKTNENGIVQWNKTYGGSGDDYLRSIKQTSDNGYIFAGFTDSYGQGSTDVYLVKTDSIGDTLWTKTFGGSTEDEGWSVSQTADGGYIVGGFTKSFGNGLADFYLLKLTSSGAVSWTRTYGDNDSDSGISVEQTNDGGYIFAGTTRSFGAGMGDYWLIKTDSTGDTLWTKTYGDFADDYCRSVKIMSDESGYILGGFTQSYGAGLSDAYVLFTDLNGDTVSTFLYGGTNNDEVWSVSPSANDVLIVGTTSSFGNGGSDIFLIKYTYSSTGINKIAHENLTTKVYADISGNIIFRVQNSLQNGELRIFDITGKEIAKLGNITNTETSINCSSLKKGLYLFTLQDGSQVNRGKFILK